MSLLSPTKNDFEVAGCLRRLFRHRYILRTKNKQWFQNILDHRSSIQEALAPFFLTLIIDESLGVIYLKESDDEIEEKLSFQLGRKKTLTPYASLILIQLRHERLQFYLNPDDNTSPLIKKDQLRDYIKEFDVNTIDARFEKAFQKALKELLELQVLVETQKDSEIYEISAVCDLLLPVDELQLYRQKINNYFQADINIETLKDGELQ